MNYTFQSVTLETFGGVESLTMKFLSLLAVCLTEVSSDTREGAWLFQHLSLPIARENLSRERADLLH